MIATPKKPKPELTREHHQQRFLAMLPTITRVAHQTFSDLGAEAKEARTVNPRVPTPAAWSRRPG